MGSPTSASTSAKGRAYTSSPSLFTMAVNWGVLHVMQFASVFSFTRGVSEMDCSV